MNARIILDGEEPSVEVVTSLALSNYGIFTTMRVDDGGVRGLALHLQRLRRDAQMAFGCAVDESLVRSCIRQTSADMLPCIVRVTVFPRTFSIEKPSASDVLHVLAFARPVPTSPATAQRLRTTTFTRDLAAVKHAGLMTSFHQRRQAQLAGYDDALFVDGDDIIGEGPTWNIGFFQDGVVVLPEADILDGITIRLLRCQCDAANITVVSRAIQRSELGNFEAAFLTNAGLGVHPIGQIDNHKYESVDVCNELRSVYDNGSLELA